MVLQISRRDEATEERITTLAVTGTIDLSSHQLLVDAGAETILSGRSLVLDLSEVDFMDSTGIGALVELSKCSQRSGCTFALSAVSPQVHRVLEVTGLAGVWSRT